MHCFHSVRGGSPDKLQPRVPLHLPQKVAARQRKLPNVPRRCIVVCLLAKLYRDNSVG